MFIATSMASELVQASVILFSVGPGQKSFGKRGGLIPILGKAMKKIVFERKMQRCKRIAKTRGNGEHGVEAPNASKQDATNRGSIILF
ncbi:hypothetical protein NPIL_101641 [Nephila pilipes]|uniref:Uncharacterized protein n=1 Tax=Nephila pilipes TaxID=299642 RepID=A0A8X6TPM6_NEPPI|nr:hypothetical protein NPIL_101641 [Nephila pilipes]